MFPLPHTCLLPLFRTALGFHEGLERDGGKIISRDLGFIFLFMVKLKFGPSVLISYADCMDFYLFFFLFFVIFLDDIWESGNYAAAIVLATLYSFIHSFATLIEYRFFGLSFCLQVIEILLGQFNVAIAICKVMITLQ